MHKPSHCPRTERGWGALNPATLSAAEFQTVMDAAEEQNRPQSEMSFPLGRREPCLRLISRPFDGVLKRLFGLLCVGGSMLPGCAVIMWVQLLAVQLGSACLKRR